MGYFGTMYMASVGCANVIHRLKYGYIYGYTMNLHLNEL